MASPIEKASHFLFETQTGKQAMGFVYGMGAAVVIFGALFKITHWPGANAMLIIGMTTESFVFAVSAFEPQHVDASYDWSLVFPELVVEDVVEGEEGDEKKGKKHNGTVTQELDNMLEEAKIGPELIESLGQGLRSLSDNANKLSNISDASVATNEYSQTLVDAKNKVSQLTDSYAQASEALTGLKDAQEAGASAGQHLQEMSNNISALNSIYELQIQSANDYMKSSNEAFSGIAELISNLNDSVEDTKKYKDNISDLSRNLTALNTVYGNMLSAMNINPRG